MRNIAAANFFILLKAYFAMFYFPNARGRTYRRLTGVLFLLLLIIDCFAVSHAATERLVKVAQVLDGDTVILSGGERVRLLGINTPEIETRYQSEQPLARQAKQALAQRVEKRQVRMRVGAQARDHYGRTLAHLFLLDGADVQQALLKQGLAWAVAIPPNLKHLRRYAQAECEARRRRLGIWAHPHFARQPIQVGKARKNGFQRITGTVTAASHARKNVRLLINDTLTIRINKQSWQKFWRNRDAKQLLGQPITARGWVKTHANKNFMWVGHPFMLRANCQTETE